MKHLTIAQLLAFGDPALQEKERAVHLEHMDTCETCRNRFISLQSFGTAIRFAPKPSIPYELTRECVPQELMGDFLGARLPATERNLFSQHLADCDICFERAAYLTSHSVRMTAGVLEMEPTPEHFLNAALNRNRAAKKETAPQVSAWDSLVRWMASPLPAYAFAVTALLFLLLGSFTNGREVVALNSDAVFTLYDKPMRSGPSFGFSDAGKKVGEVNAGLDVSKIDSEKIQFNWNKVDGATGYNFQLMEITPAGQKSVYNEKTGAPVATAQVSSLAPGSAYRWKVTGMTESGQVFVAQGQFAYTN